MSLNSRDDQAEKAKAIASQAKASPPASNQLEASEKIRKEKKKKWQWKKWASKDAKEVSPSPTTSGSNAVQATGSQKKKKSRDVFEVIYYSYNKKGHYTSNCTEPKAKK